MRLVVVVAAAASMLTRAAIRLSVPVVFAVRRPRSLGSFTLSLLNEQFIVMRTAVRQDGKMAGPPFKPSQPLPLAVMIRRTPEDARFSLLIQAKLT